MTEANVLARRLVAFECEAGSSKNGARLAVARKAGIAPGTIENLLAGRLKKSSGIQGALRELFVRTIERKISDLERWRSAAFASGDRCRPIDFDQLDAALAEARKALGKG